MQFRLSSTLCSLAASLLSILLVSTPASTSELSEAASISAIRNKINLYSVLLDNKDYGALDRVFTQDVAPFGLEKLEALLRAALEDSITLHYSDTEYVEIGPTSDTASAVSYMQAIYFAKDANTTDQTCTFYERNMDDFVLRGGEWLILNRTLSFTVSFLWAVSLCYALYFRVDKFPLSRGTFQGVTVRKQKGTDGKTRRSLAIEPFCRPPSKPHKWALVPRQEDGQAPCNIRSRHM